MKKLKKVTILCLIAAISVLIAIGCSNDNSSDEPVAETTTTATTTDDTQTPAGTTTTPTAPADNPSSGSDDDEDEPECTCASDCPSGYSCDANNTCVREQPACDADYYSNGNECIACPEHMRQNSAGDGCLCVDGYYLEGGQCVENPTGCYTYEDGRCTRCVAGYHLVDGVCERDQETPASGCAICGDGRLDEGEDCDGTLFRDPNLPEGVSCSNCRYDYSNVIWENM